MTEAGFLEIFIDNQAQTPVYYDNLSVTYWGGFVLEYNTYYPYGGLIPGLSAAAAPEDYNAYKFSGKELETALNLSWYDFGARPLDPTIARWITPDPLAEKYYHISPYVYALNNPLRFIDPFGLDSLDAVALKTAAANAVQFVTDKYGSSAAYCNQGVNQAFAELTGSNELAGKNANNMVDQLESSDNFTKINQSEVQKLANDGTIVIAGKKESSGSGHVALAVPGVEVRANKENWGGSAPMGMDTGWKKRWSSNGMNYSWATNTGVNFYKYLGSTLRQDNNTGSTLGQDNNTYFGGTLSEVVISAPGRQLLQPLPISRIRIR
jgi:RHS repeat-associated protein